MCTSKDADVTGANRRGCVCSASVCVGLRLFASVRVNFLLPVRDHASKPNLVRYSRVCMGVFVDCNESSQAFYQNLRLPPE